MRHPRLDADYLRECMYGRWRDYFIYIGLELPATNSKHGPCPHCGGKDRFRLDDKNGSGSYICSQCGAGDGLSLLMKVNGCTFPEALKVIANYLGIAATDTPIAKPQSRPPPPAPVFDNNKHKKITDMLKQTERLGWPLVRYFQNRGLTDLSGQVPDSLRYHAALPYWMETTPGRWENTGTYPAMIGLVTNLDNEVITLHRTYLTEQGKKAPCPSTKKLMSPALPGSLRGCCIKLGVPTDTLYLTEGIETGLAVMLATGGAVWSCISDKLLEQVEIPESVNNVFIMADLDRSKAGEISANRLAQRLLTERNDMTVSTCLPPGPIPEGAKGLDWLDTYYQNSGGVAA